MKLILTQVIERVKSRVSSICIAAALLGIIAGCATTVQTEDLLTGAGFKARPAISAEQQAQLKSLPARKVSSVQKDGKKYFVYPDAARNVVYIGQSAEYQRYQQLRKQWDMAEEQHNPAEEQQLQWTVEGIW